MQQQMVGLAIAEIFDTPTEKIAEMLSLFVLPDHRQQGIGSNLIKGTEKVCTAHQCQKLVVHYKATSLAQQALESIFQQRDWQLPTLELLLMAIDQDNIKTVPWIYKYPLPPEFTIFPWTELSDSDKAHLRQAVEYPQSLSPFDEDPRLEPMNSLGLRYQDQVIGWILTHRVKPDTLRYTTMYVAPPFQRMARGISLFNESVRRQLNSDIPYATAAVAKDNKPMQRFVKRYVFPYAQSVSESRLSLKTFVTV